VALLTLLCIIYFVKITAVNVLNLLTVTKYVFLSLHSFWALNNQIFSFPCVWLFAHVVPRGPSAYLLCNFVGIQFSSLSFVYAQGRSTVRVLSVLSVGRLFGLLLKDIDFPVRSDFLCVLIIVHQVSEYS
jgi:hypothetical protein